jgi:hypothetical protein
MLAASMPCSSGATRRSLLPLGAKLLGHGQSPLHGWASEPMNTPLLVASTWHRSCSLKVRQSSPSRLSGLQKENDT